MVLEHWQISGPTPFVAFDKRQVLQDEEVLDTRALNYFVAGLKDKIRAEIGRGRFSLNRPYRLFVRLNLKKKIYRQLFGRFQWDDFCITQRKYFEFLIDSVPKTITFATASQNINIKTRQLWAKELQVKDICGALQILNRQVAKQMIVDLPIRRRNLYYL